MATPALRQHAPLPLLLHSNALHPAPLSCLPAHPSPTPHPPTPPLQFDSFTTTGSAAAPRRPPCDNLYDVFINIRDDELEHVVTMTACQSPAKIAGDIQAKKRPASPEAGADKKEAGLTTGPAGGAYVPRAYLSSKDKKK